jgi:hypothetical protein
MRALPTVTKITDLDEEMTYDFWKTSGANFYDVLMSVGVRIDSVADALALKMRTRLDNEIEFVGAPEECRATLAAKIGDVRPVVRMQDVRPVQVTDYLEGVNDEPIDITSPMERIRQLKLGFIFRSHRRAEAIMRIASMIEKNRNTLDPEKQFRTDALLYAKLHEMASKIELASLTAFPEIRDAITLESPEDAQRNQRVVRVVHTQPALAGAK